MASPSPSGIASRRKRSSSSPRIRERNSPATKTLPELVAALERPRRIMMMIKAGAPVDEMLDKLVPLLEPGDIVIDGGNSWFKDTQARAKRLLEHGLHFVGSGVSGGEEGARFGPSLMPGGTREAWDAIREIFEAIAARSDSGPCVTYCRPRRRRPLRQDGAQRHRVRRHAAHRRGLRPVAARPGLRRERARHDLRQVERRDAANRSSSRSPRRSSARSICKRTARSSTKSSTRPARRGPASGRRRSPSTSPSRSRPSPRRSTRAFFRR